MSTMDADKSAGQLLVGYLVIISEGGLAQQWIPQQAFGNGLLTSGASKP